MARPPVRLFQYKEDNMEFNFNKKVETDTVEKQIELEKSNEFEATDKAETKTDGAELINNTSEEAGDNKETEAKTEEPTKAVVTYIGHSEWKDSMGEKWRNGVTRPFNTNDYEKREDLKFMVGYGEMRVSFV